MNRIPAAGWCAIIMVLLGLVLSATTLYVAETDGWTPLSKQASE